ncbi:MAG: penicillin-binding protein 2 [Sphaerochaetaceae bacterium]|nr:penicillin-binding protein 2 [Sphaerochaetaceae bacterium]MDC7237035.1 penicillin-binding protein 2 [Sphaerochaetaceae bacterium]
MINGKNKRVNYNDPNVASYIIRGNIYDRNSKLLAIEVPYYSCSFRVDKIQDLTSVATMCAPYLDMDIQDIITISNNYTYQALIKSRIDDDKVEEFKTFVDDNNLTNLVKIEKQYGRDYPYSFHSSQTIGFVGYDNNGLEGLEHTLNNILYPGPGLNETITYGEDVYLTIDMNIQYLCDLEVQRVNSEYSPESIVAIVMDAKNGEILAMSSYPWYDLNNFKESSIESRKNNTISMLYEPGSVFKIFSFAALLDLDQADFDEPFYCDGSYTFELNNQSFTINCSHAHGEVTKDTMLKYSCNGAISKWALETDSQDFYDKLIEFGFDSRVDLPLNGIARSRIQNTELWSLRSKPTIAFGQELLTTAINISRAATAISNKGVLVEPKLIKQIGDTPTQDSNSKRIIKEETAKMVLEDMVLATEEGGTATKASVDGVKVAAKTGTAQLLNEETKSYEDGTSLASTIAIVDADDPKYIIYFAAKSPSKNSIWGSNVASPAVKNIIEGLKSQNKLN